MFTLKPFSPHLLIYNLQTSSVFSILHRVSALLFLITFFNSIIYYFISLNITLFQYLFFTKYYYFIIIALKYFFTKFSLFHFLNGIKIIIWNLNLIKRIGLLELINKLVILLFLILI